jgi:hypothetical protein
LTHRAVDPEQARQQSGGNLRALDFAAAVPVSHFFRELRLTSILRVVSAGFTIATIGIVPNALLARNMAAAIPKSRKFMRKIVTRVATP